MDMPPDFSNYYVFLFDMNIDIYWNRPTAESYHSWNTISYPQAYKATTWLTQLNKTSSYVSKVCFNTGKASHK